MTLKSLRLVLGLAVAVTVISLFGSQEAKAQYTSVYVGAGYPPTYYSSGYYGGHYTRYSSGYSVHRVRHVRYVEPCVVYRPAPIVPCYRYAPPPPRPGFGFYVNVNHRHGGHDRHGDHRSHHRGHRRHR